MITATRTSRLSPEQIRFYRDNGYLHVPAVFTPEEAALFRQEAHDLARRLVETRTPGVVGEGWGSGRKVTDLPRELLHCHNVQFHSAAFSRLIVDPRLTDLVADLIGPNVQLHHTKMFIKPPEKGAPFPMHQDYPYFPHERDTMMAAIVHFDDAPLEKGCVRVVPGSHKLGPLEHLRDGGHHLPVEQYPVSEATPVPAGPGDVLFFTYLTIHGSGVNESREARTTLLVQMRDPTDHPLIQTHLSRGQGVMLRGIDPEADAGPLVPSPSRFAERQQEMAGASR
jgi:phytanoyl-CoA hydroxylase